MTTSVTIHNGLFGTGPIRSCSHEWFASWAVVVS